MGFNVPLTRYLMDVCRVEKVRSDIGWLCRHVLFRKDDLSALTTALASFSEPHRADCRHSGQRSRQRQLCEEAFCDWSVTRSERPRNFSSPILADPWDRETHSSSRSSWQRSVYL